MEVIAAKTIRGHFSPRQVENRKDTL